MVTVNDGKDTSLHDEVENTRCSCGRLSPEQQEKLDALLNKHASVFSKSDDDIGYTEMVQHKIRTEDDITAVRTNSTKPISRSERTHPKTA